ncbi:MAG: adenylate/guanylate cyclase domain-containing protein, partial [Pirellulaceae bacterium]
DYRDAGQKIAVLSQLPDVISRAANDTDLHVQIVNILMTGIRRATTVGIVRHVDHDKASEVIHWDQRLVTSGDFQPSGQLIHRAVESGETVLHLWKTGGQFGADQMTVLRDGDWAFVSPLPGAAAEGMAIYVSGNYDLKGDSDPKSDPLDLHDDIKFTELIATTLANLRQVRRLEQNQASLRSFFSPVVLDAIATQDPDKALSPRECEVSVLFCDLRGFSLRSEEYAEDLPELLNRVSGALGVTTSEILGERGVVGDFHGDSAMGFWGWPLDQPDRAMRACRAALQIQQEFARFASEPEHPLNDFRIGMGIATGNAVAGRIGTDDQVKVTVFGPVVNVAARLETMTARMRAAILVDQRTDQLIRVMQKSDDLPSLPRVRRLAIIKPFGMNNSIAISQVLPPADDPGALDAQAIETYERGLDEFTAGNWESAFELLHQVPADDQAKDFLTVYIAQHNRTAPPDWPGFIALQQK